MTEIIRNKRVLCTSSSIRGHMIPVLTLAKYFAPNNEVVFLHSNDEFKLRRKYKIKCIQIEPDDSNTLINKNDIIKYCDIINNFNPDITFSDWSLSFHLAATIKKTKCNVSILRAELFIGYKIINYHLRQNLIRQKGKDWIKILEEMGMPVVSDIRELMTGDITIIPSIPEIDVIPNDLPEVYRDKSIEFIGPLFTDISLNLKKAELNKWINDQKCINNKKLILITLGTASDESLSLYVNLLRKIKDIDAAFIFIISSDKHREKVLNFFEQSSNIKILPFYSLTDILQHADLAIHHCGHGLLHQCLYHGVPSITFPTGCFDREDNAVRLEKLGVNLRFASSLESFDIKNLIITALNSDKMKKAALKHQIIIKSFLNTKGPKYLEKKIFDVLNKNAI